MNEELIEFCNYIQPIISGCSGFIKTDGYVTHFPGTIVLMSADETVCSIINIPVVYNYTITAVINTLLGLKEDEQKSNLFENIYFVGYNIKHDHLLNYYNLFSNIDNTNRCIFYEPDCYNIDRFTECSSNILISSVNVSDGINNYKVPASKSITQLNKSDTVSLKIYDFIYNPFDQYIKTIRYSMFKKKFKLTVDIFSNILVV